MQSGEGTLEPESAGAVCSQGVYRCRSLTKSYRNHLTAVIGSKGCATKYKVQIRLRVPSFLSWSVSLLISTIFF